MELSRQEFWSGLPFATSGDLFNPGIKPISLSSPALAGGSFTTSTTWEAQSPHAGQEKNGGSGRNDRSALTIVEK